MGMTQQNANQGATPMGMNPKGDLNGLFGGGMRNTMPFGLSGPGTAQPPIMQGQGGGLGAYGQGQGPWGMPQGYLGSLFGQMGQGQRFPLGAVGKTMGTGEGGGGGQVFGGQRNVRTP